MDRKPPLARLHRAARQVGRLRPGRLNHFAQPDAARLHRFHVHPNSDLGIGNGPHVGSFDARHLLERVLHALGFALQAAVGRRLAHQRDLEDDGVARRGAHQFERGDALGQIASHFGNGLGDGVEAVVGVGVGFELGHDNCQSVLDRRVERFQVVEFVDLLLDRVDDFALDVFGPCAGVDHDDARRRDFEDGVFGARHRQKALDAEQRQHHHDDEGELVVLDREARERHGGRGGEA